MAAPFSRRLLFVTHSPMANPQLDLFPQPQQNKISRIIKRDGRLVAFNKLKITNAIYRAAAHLNVQGSGPEFTKLLQVAIPTSIILKIANFLPVSIKDAWNVIYVSLEWSAPHLVQFVL